MKSLFLTLLCLAFVGNDFGQNSTIDLTFTSIQDNSYIKLDSIKVINRTQNIDTVLFYPDTTLVLEYLVGINKKSKKSTFQVFQNFPNPFGDRTTFKIYCTETSNVRIKIIDFAGRTVINTIQELSYGDNYFEFLPGYGNVFFLTAECKGIRSSIKLIQCSSEVKRSGSVSFLGNEMSAPLLKRLSLFQNFSFNLGDTLLCIGYSGDLQSGILDDPKTSRSYTYQFAVKIPCPGTPTVTYEGQVYNTVQIFSQCWMKENLNVGTMIPGNKEMADNDTIEKYCIGNNPANCILYGGLYQWEEIMHYSTQQGIQGICPSGWHIPTDEEWKVLEGAVDDVYGIGDPEWDAPKAWRGMTVGVHLKSISGWASGGFGDNHSGFTAQPYGYRLLDGSFSNIGYNGIWYTSTQGISSYAWYRSLACVYGLVSRYQDSKQWGYSVRCLRDN